MTDSDEKQRALDASMENESVGHKDNYGPMVQISLKEYDKLKERSKYITDRDLITGTSRSILSRSRSTTVLPTYGREKSTDFTRHFGERRADYPMVRPANTDFFSRPRVGNRNDVGTRA